MNKKTQIAIIAIALLLAGGGVGYLFGKIGRAPFSAGETVFTAYLTGYSYWDNTPPDSTAIAFPKSKGYPTAHDEAGGSGSNDDPITLAVGHAEIDGADRPDFEPGTLFYIPDFKKYAIAEDACGDSASQGSGCHAGYYTRVWLDLWIGGSSASVSSGQACEDKITGLHQVIANPKRGYPVKKGALLVSAPCK